MTSYFNKKVKKPRLKASFNEGLQIISKAKQERDYIIMRLQLYGALREGEILGSDYPVHGSLNPLTPNDINFDKGHIAIHGKGGSFEYQPIDKKTLELLANYIIKKKIKSSKPIFNITCRHYQYLVKAAAREAKFENWKRFSPHVFRAMSITYMANKKDLATAQFHARHSSWKTTMIYNRPTDEMKQRVYEEVFDQ